MGVKVGESFVCMNTDPGGNRVFVVLNAILSQYQPPPLTSGRGPEYAQGVPFLEPPRVAPYPGVRLIYSGFIPPPIFAHA